jgi:hypothetical protein
MRRCLVADVGVNAAVLRRIPDYPETSLAYANARETLRNIRRLLARRDLDSG